MPNNPSNTEGEKELDRLKDKSSLWDSMQQRPCFISFYTGKNGAGYALREMLKIDGKHFDKRVERKADRMAKRLGANSWVVFKPIGMPRNVDWPDEYSRLESLEES